ncbi:hypothetical protein AB0L05_37105 [Nonomuraea pusilla]|uniref:hypothetical protein n=1 Tax=Nonomuraea pusilla TaxID=46177 RepID=UPI003320BDCD
MVDDDAVPGPEETLRLIEEQRAATVRRLKGDPLLFYAPWGTAWLIGFTAFFLHYGLDGRRYAPISQGQALPQLPPAEATLIWAGMSMLVVAVLYMAGGAIWLDWRMFFAGVWVAAVDTLGVLLGIGWHALLTAVLLGGGFIVMSLWLRRRG